MSAAPASPSKSAALIDERGAIALVVANTIGTGVFTTSGFALGDLGAPSYVMLAWAAGGLYALSGVVVYADLATKIPVSGGEYAFLRQTLHPALGVVAGWISLVAGFTAPIAASALGAELYLTKAGGPVWSAPFVASAIVLVLSLLHAFAPKQGVAFQNVAVLIKVLAIVAFVGFGAPHAAETVSRGDAGVAPFSTLAFFGSLVWISYAYSGWNAAVYVTGEVAGGGVTVRRALYAGTLLVMVLYLGVSAVILYGAPIEALKGVAESGAVAARSFGGPVAERALSALIALALVTSASSMIVSGPRVYARMAQDGALPAILGRLHGERPRIAVLTQGVLALLVVWSASLRDILEFVGVTLSLSAAAVVVGWIRLELRASYRPRFVQAGAALLFLLATAGVAVAAILMRPMSALASTALIGAAAIAYFGGAHGRRRSANSS
ncbi:MAG TPA: amino acid permease [Methylosinus sp.]|jgi:APA family basic amino acid/polyamine antiporter|uniref:APC family permease n=1 Tax=Methylosinus sp. TaxID=427 RepID=UPI002F946B4C